MKMMKALSKLIWKAMILRWAIKNSLLLQKYSIVYARWIRMSRINYFYGWFSGILFTVYNIYRCSLKYSQYPVTTELSTEDGSNSSTSFPLGSASLCRIRLIWILVTICLNSMHSKMKTSKVSSSDTFSDFEMNGRFLSTIKKIEF